MRVCGSRFFVSRVLRYGDFTMTRWCACLGLGLLSLAIFGGCGEPPPALFPVQGSVTLDGQPLATGTVYLKTVQTGAIDTLPVKDGKFMGKAMAGKRKVEVAAHRMIPVPGEMGGEVQESLIASRYNSESTLTAEVTTTGPNEFKFEVESK